MYSNKPIKFRVERRKKPDIICKLLEIAVVIVWCLIFAILCLVHFSKPVKQTFFDHLFGIQVNKSINYDLLNTAFYLLIFLFIFSLISLFFNSKRLKRRTDRIRISFILSLIGSLAGIVICLIYFNI